VHAPVLGHLCQRLLRCKQRLPPEHDGHVWNRRRVVPNVRSSARQPLQRSVPVRRRADVRNGAALQRNELCVRLELVSDRLLRLDGTLPHRRRNDGMRKRRRIVRSMPSW
jgi:hypothetical protein